MFICLKLFSKIAMQFFKNFLLQRRVHRPSRTPTGGPAEPPTRVLLYQTSLNATDLAPKLSTQKGFYRMYEKIEFYYRKVSKSNNDPDPLNGSLKDSLNLNEKDPTYKISKPQKSALLKQ